MPTYILYCKADLEGIESLTLNTTTTTETNDDDDDDGAGGATATAVDCPHMLSFSVCNPTDKEQKREKIVVETHELHDAVVGNHSKHRNETPYHFTMKWDNHSSSGITGNEATLRVLGIDLQSQQQQQNDDNDKTTFQRSQKKIKQTGNSKEMEAALHKVRSMKADDSGTMVPMLAVFCENMEPYAFHPLGNEGEFIAVGKNGKIYNNVDLSDGDWSDYDLSTGSVAVTNFETKFI